ncbi:hypothetical protein, partial [Flavobacterium sp. NKUCC04_CG]|uniref:beta strand repeat-containing protein n=1 Tax=Flavobacterium sp. NKUCC04_CG TaxID=2842121 RepID=UPI001C5BFA19
GNVYYDGTQFTYIDQAGNTHIINFEDIVQANETLTILGYTTTNGMLTYQDEKGNITTVDIKGAVKSFETLTSLTSDAANGTITFKDEKEQSHVINIKDLVGMSEKITTLTKNPNGTYTYKNEADALVTFDPSMVNVTYANGIYTFKDNLGNTLTEINTNASNIIYNNVTSGLTSVNVQGAIDELVSKFNNIAIPKGNLTGTGISVTNGTDATLKNTQIAITPGGPGQIMATNSAGNATEWIDKSAVVPTTTNTLTKEGTNTIVSTVNGVVAKANLVESVVNAITGSSIMTTVNGVASTAIDLTNAIQAGQKTVTVVNGENTTVTSTASGNNTEYKVNVSKTDIQAAQKTTVVAAGTGITVTPNTLGNETTYTVATSGTTAVTLAGDVTGPTTNTKVERIQTVPVSSVAPRNNEVLTFDGTTWKPAAPTQVTKGNLTGTGITVTDGNEATLRNVQIAITPGSAGQMLVTNPAGNGTLWVDTSAITPLITNVLSKEGTNTLVSTVNGVVAKANLVESVVNAITGSSIMTTVNGVASTAIDLTNVIQAGQKTVTVVNGENTTVTSSASGNNTEYKVNVSKTDIQAAQKTTIVAAGTGITVTPNTSGNETTYTVATSGTTAVTLAGDVTGPSTNTKVERIQTVPVSSVAPRNNEVLTFDGTSWKPVLPTVDAGTITNGKAFTSTDLDLQGDPNTSLLKAVSANIKIGAVTSEKILDGTIKPIDMNSEGSNLVLTTDASGRPTWINKSDLNQASQKTSSVVGATTDVVVTPTVTGDNTEYSVAVKAAMPKFFYMPAVIFDTNTNGAKTKNLYTEYTAQFGAGGGMISSANSSGFIPVLPANQLEFYVTYYDPAVFSNLSIDVNGVLSYTVIGKATRASYMNIVFVVK